MKILYTVYLLAFVAANLIVKHFGAPGLLFSSFFLIPFDFVARCIIHERYRGAKLIAILSGLTIAAAVVTIIFNYSALNIAAASICGFTAAQIAAGIFYQSNKGKSFFYKVNISDLFAIVSDSIIFQFVAFSSLDLKITAGQIVIKFLGGLLWYWILFKKLRLAERLTAPSGFTYRTGINEHGKNETIITNNVTKESKHFFDGDNITF